MNIFSAQHDSIAPAEGALLEARFGLRLAAHLNTGTQTLPHDIQERLRVARQAAVARAVHSKRQLAVSSTPIRIGHDAALIMGSPGESWWVRLGALAPLLILVAGLLFIQEWQRLEQIDAAAEIDAEILSDNLPPAAYVDPGFSEFLQVPASTIQE